MPSGYRLLSNCNPRERVVYCKSRERNTIPSLRERINYVLYNDLLLPFRSTENFSLIRRRHHYGEGLTILTYAKHLRPLSSKGFFSVLHRLWHGAFVLYNDYPWVPVTLTPIDERMEFYLSLPVFTTSEYRSWDSNTQPPACGVNTQTDCAGFALDSEEIMLVSLLLLCMFTLTRQCYDGRYWCVCDREKTGV